MPLFNMPSNYASQIDPYGLVQPTLTGPIGGLLSVLLGNPRLKQILLKYVKDSVDRMPPRKYLPNILRQGSIQEVTDTLDYGNKGLPALFEEIGGYSHPSSGALLGTEGNMNTNLYPFRSSGPVQGELFENLSQPSQNETDALINLIEEFATSWRPGMKPGFSGWE